MKQMETDVVIVAGGPAGLAAAVTVGEMGLSSILLEKARTTGGAANMGMGPLGINTSIQKEQFNDITVDYAFDLHMNYPPTCASEFENLNFFFKLPPHFQKRASKSEYFTPDKITH